MNMWVYFTTIVAALLQTVAADAEPSFHGATEWSGWGANYRNNHWVQDSHVSSSNIHSLAEHCKISYPTGVSAAPAISGNIAYYPTWDGTFVALDYTSCRVVWEINVTRIISDFEPISDALLAQTKAVSRTSPQVDDEVVYFGTQTHALAVAVDRLTGKTLAAVKINQHPMAVITMSPTLFEGKLFIGSSSVEENLSLDPSYPCCSFIGNFVALSFSPSEKRFTVLWNTTMIPALEASMGWSGVSLWGSQPSIDTARRQLFVATGNTYSIPDVIVSCQNATQNITAVTQGLVSDPCLPRDVLQESVLALDIDLGIINWVHQLPRLDAFTAACGYPGFSTQNRSLCPQTPGLDTDFGMAPTFVPGSNSTPYGKDIVVVGQKNGILYAFSAQAGQLFWSTPTGPAGLAGGLSWGVAADVEAVYFTQINSGYLSWQVQPSNVTTDRSAFGAVALGSGEVLWETPVPGGGVSFSPPTVVGDLVVVGKTGTDPEGNSGYDRTEGSVVVLEKGTGRVAMEYGLESNMHGGVAVKDEYLLFGQGYKGFGVGALVPGAFTVLKVSSNST